MSGDLFDAIVRDVGHHDSGVGGRGQVDVVGADAVARDDFGLFQRPDEVTVKRHITVQQCVGVEGELEGTVARAVGHDQVRADFLEYLALHLDIGENLVRHNDFESIHLISNVTLRASSFSSRASASSAWSMAKPAVHSGARSSLFAAVNSIPFA